MNIDGETDNASLTVDDAAARLSAMFGDDADKKDDEQELEAAADAQEGDEGHSNDVDDDELEIDDEPETAIEPPARFSAEDKEQFARLDPKAQAFVADLELRRNQQVTEVTTRAADAEKAAQHAAQQADAKARLVYTEQLRAFGQQLAPIAPDIALAKTDPLAFNAQYARYTIAMQDHQSFMSQIEMMANDAESAIDETFTKARDAELLKVPEVANEETRAAFFEHVFTAAGSLRGIDAEALKGASADDLINLRAVAAWKEDAEKYRAALSRQMQRVREGKNVAPKRRSNERPIGGAQEKARQQFGKSNSVKDAAALISKML